MILSTLMACTHLSLPYLRTVGGAGLAVMDCRIQKSWITRAIATAIIRPTRAVHTPVILQAIMAECMDTLAVGIIVTALGIKNTIQFANRTVMRCKKL